MSVKVLFRLIFMQLCFWYVLNKILYTIKIN